MVLGVAEPEELTENAAFMHRYACFTLSTYLAAAIFRGMRLPIPPSSYSLVLVSSSPTSECPIRFLSRFLSPWDVVCDRPHQILLPRIHHTVRMLDADANLNVEAHNL